VRREKVEEWIEEKERSAQARQDAMSSDNIVALLSDNRRG